MGGQQCYTYYENVCENTNEAQCNMKGNTCRWTRDKLDMYTYFISRPGGFSIGTFRFRSGHNNNRS